MKRLYFFARRTGVTLPLLAVMEYVRGHEGCLINSIADWLGVTRTPVHNYLHRLRELGLVETTEATEDTRLRYVTLTERGKGLMKRAEKLIRKS